MSDESFEQAFRAAVEVDGPVVVHCLTQKGRGYAPAENDPIKNMHDTSELKPGSYTAAFTEALVKLGEEHPNLVAITAAMPSRINGWSSTVRMRICSRLAA